MDKIKGSNQTWIRPIITIIAAIGISVGFFLDKISSDAYIGIMAVAITWYFKARDEEKKNGEPKV